MTRKEKNSDGGEFNARTVKKFLSLLDDMTSDPSSVATEYFALSAPFVTAADIDNFTRHLVTHIAKSNGASSIQRQSYLRSLTKSLEKFYDHVNEQNRLADNSGEALHKDLLAAARYMMSEASPGVTAQDMKLVIDRIERRGSAPPPLERTAGVPRTLEAENPAATGQITDDLKISGKKLLGRHARIRVRRFLTQAYDYLTTSHPNPRL